MVKSAPYAFAFLTAVCWGVAPLLGKAGLHKTDPLTGLCVRSFTVSAVLLVLLFATGCHRHLVHLPAHDARLLMAEGLVAALLGHFAYYYALKYGVASRVVPIAACFPLFALAGGMLFFAERLTVVRLCGTALIIAGVVLLKR